MQAESYERHIHEDPQFPVKFHSDDKTINTNGFALHWHEHLEILHFTKGKGRATSDTFQYDVEAGDTFVINSNCMHSIHTGGNCLYHCLIIDKEFCENNSIPIGDISFKDLIKDVALKQQFDVIVEEMREKKPYYKSSVKAHAIELLVILCRNYANKNTSIPENRGNQKLSMVKKSVEYIRLNYKNTLTIDDICSHIGFSKYYFCRSFKEITGKTVVDYMNFLKCNYAEKLLASGVYNVSESAQECGFCNLSYFTKTYKKQMGKMPSVVLGRNEIF